MANLKIRHYIVWRANFFVYFCFMFCVLWTIRESPIIICIFKQPMHSHIPSYHHHIAIVKSSSFLSFALLSTSDFTRMNVVYPFNIITHPLVHGVRALVDGLLYCRMYTWYKRVQSVANDDVDRNTSGWVITKEPNTVSRNLLIVY